VPAPAVQLARGTPQPRRSEIMTAASPRPTPRPPTSLKTEVLGRGDLAIDPPTMIDQRVPGGEREPRSRGGRKKSDSRQPLDFSETQQIGRFGLIREIARGGMGQVFLARDTKLGRKVAIKFLLHDDPNFVQRFLIEARATARCTHENIVTIFEVGEHDGLPYMVLEYLEGKTLTQLLETRPTARQFAELMVPVARALERAHEHGIVHRDLKPSNIFVTDRGHVKVLDFGVARVFDAPVDPLEQMATRSQSQSEHVSETTYVTFSGNGSLVGTLPYMSPEQWGSDTVDTQSDIWAVGIMFWRALTGVHPAGTMNAEKLKEKLCDLDTSLPSIGSREPTLPRDLVAIVDRCLAKRKADRYHDASELLSDLQAHLAPAAERIAEDACPYRGLAAFGEGDAKFFFGRSAEIRTALSQLEMWPLLAVIGPSGVGKSSFVHAGLVPAVRGTGGQWQIRVLRPGRSPLQSLAAVLDDAIETGQVTAGMMEQLHESPGLFGEMLRKSAARKRHKVLIVVDQLEELFTLSTDDNVRKLFLAALLAAADDPSAPVRVVLSMRADFLDRLAGHKHFLAELSRGLFFLSAPDKDNLRETLVRPAELAGYGFEDPWIVEDMLEAATSRGALPLLQFAATRLWDSRDRGKKLLTISSYNAMGGIGGAFARHADEVAAAVPARSQLLLRAIMTRLVTPEGTRAVIDHDELLGLAADSSEVERVLDQLLRARLVVMQTDPGQGSTVEIVHEVLITEWPTLTRWLEDSQSLRGFMQELRQATKQWVSRGKPHALVWRDAMAQEALTTAKRHVLDLSAAEREFLDSVRKVASRGRRRKVVVFTAIFAVLGGVIAGGAFFMIRLKAEESTAEQATATAQQATTKAQADRKTAEDATAKYAAQIDALQTAQARTQKAEGVASEAKGDLKVKNEQLEKALADAQHDKDEAQREKLKALELAKIAAASEQAANKARDDAKAANAQLAAKNAEAAKQIQKLEAEKKAIYSGGLK